MKKWTVALACAFTAALALPSAAQDGNWPHWRGPTWDGGTKASDLPEQFSKTENVKWVVDMPGPSAATPIIWGDKVFASSTDERRKVLMAFCLDRKTGDVLWKKDVAVGFDRDDKSNYASPSPVTDGERVIFFYGTGDLAAFDLDGKELWSKNIQKEYGEFAFQWTFSTSPTLFDGRLYMQVLQRDVPVGGRGAQDAPSYLLALDPKTGQELFKSIRHSKAVAESREAFSTPIPHTWKGREEILIAGGDAISGHDPKTGRELWRWGTWNPTRIRHWRLVPSPAAGAGIVLACGPKGSPVYAVKAGGAGDLPDSALAWVSEDRHVSSDVPTPLFYSGRFYILNRDRKSISCVEPESGKVIWTGELDSRPVLESSPTAGDGKIYFMNHDGRVWVVAAQDEFKILHQTDMGGDGDRDLRASVAIAHGDLFIRAGNKLYCISKG